MTIRYTKRSRHFRGSRHNGWGIVGQHRKKGKKGGFGKTGGMKHKWTYTVVYEPDRFGKHGFQRPVAVQHPDTTITFVQLETRLKAYEAAGIAQKKGSAIEIDLGKAGVTKLLGSGQVHGKYTITVQRASKKAVEKVAAAGGSVSVLDTGDE